MTPDIVSLAVERAILLEFYRRNCCFAHRNFLCLYKVIIPLLSIPYLGTYILTHMHAYAKGNLY